MSSLIKRASPPGAGRSARSIVLPDGQFGETTRKGWMKQPCGYTNISDAIRIAILSRRSTVDAAVQLLSAVLALDMEVLATVALVTLPTSKRRHYIRRRTPHIKTAPSIKIGDALPREGTPLQNFGQRKASVFCCEESIALFWHPRRCGNARHRFIVNQRPPETTH